MKAKERREAERQRLLKEAGGEPDYERGAPGDRKRQNRSFDDAARGLTEEESEGLHREVTKRDLPFQEVRRRARQIVVGRKK